MFGTKTKAADDTIARLSAALSAMEIDPATASAEAATARLEVVRAQASAEASTTYADRITALEAEKVALSGRIAAHVAAFAAAGIVVAPDATEGAITEAIQARIAAASAKVVAAAGHEVIAIAQGEGTAERSPKEMTQVELSDAIQAERDPRKRKDLYNVFKQRFLSN